MAYLEADTVATQSVWRTSLSSTGGMVRFDVGASPVQSGKRNKEVQEAILQHIQALRGLGRTRVNTRDIAAALDLPRIVVEQAVRGLQDEGVKIAR